VVVHTFNPSRLSQEVREFEKSLDDVARTCLKKKIYIYIYIYTHIYKVLNVCYVVFGEAAGLF
jgi:hypothetical protein